PTIREPSRYWTLITGWLSDSPNRTLARRRPELPSRGVAPPSAEALSTIGSTVAIAVGQRPSLSGRNPPRTVSPGGTLSLPSRSHVPFPWTPTSFRAPGGRLENRRTTALTSGATCKRQDGGPGGQPGQQRLAHPIGLGRGISVGTASSSAHTKCSSRVRNAPGVG